MKKSQRGKSSKKRNSTSGEEIDRNDPIVKMLLQEQLKAFVEKFGRMPLEGEPIFFDETKDTPTEMDESVVHDAFMFLLKDAPPEIIYAYKKTGRVLLADLRETYPPEFVAEYDAAIAEYFALEKAGKNH
jgi:hypothetical protein